MTNINYINIALWTLFFTGITIIILSLFTLIEPRLVFGLFLTILSQYGLKYRK
jgi:hypothetical protein